MGKQLPIVMTFNDEKLFLSQIKNISDFQLIKYFADKKEEIFVNKITEELENNGQYYLWNKKLSWNFKYKYTKTDPPKIYIEDMMYAPFIAFTRQHEFPSDKDYGRIFVNTFTQENLPYNKSELINTYNEIVKIIKKTSCGKIKDGLVTYFYPESWKKYQEKI